MRLPCFILLQGLVLGSATAALVNYEITGYVPTNPNTVKGAGGPIFNTSTDVPGSGSSANFLAASVNDYVDFTIGDASNPGAGTVAHLRVTITQLAPGTDVMLARTSNSQGLTDAGTFSLLLDNTAAGGATTATIQLEWFQADGLFTTRLANEYTITSFDIDFRQFNEFQSSELSSVILSDTFGSTPSVLTQSTSGSFTRLSDLGNTDATVDNPANAAVFQTVSSHTQSIGVGKESGSGPQLYMYEFRNPPTNVEIQVPEPGVFGLAALGMLGALWRRRNPACTG